MKNTTPTPKGLRPTAWRLLKLIADLDGHPMTYAEIAAEINVNPATVGRTLSKLKAEGYLIVSDNKRHHTRTLTEAGWAAL